MTDGLILELDSERPPNAEDLGEVFSALARDYREMTNGRTLVVVRVESGSITATLTDAALAAAPYLAAGGGDGLAIIAAMNTLAEFGGNLKKWFGYAKSDNEKKRLFRKRKRSSGQRSVEAIIEIAANTGGHIRVKYKSEKGETLDVELTPTEAISARKQPPAEEIKEAHSETELQILRSAPVVQRAIARLAQIDEQNLPPTGVLAVVDVIVAALQAAGAGYFLSEIVSELEMRGFHNIANAMRQHIRRPSGTHEPPLSNT